MKTASKSKVRRFSAAQEKTYIKRRTLARQIRAHQNAAAELKKQVDKLDEKLKPIFVQNFNKLQLKTGNIVLRKVVKHHTTYITEEMVGDVLRTGYQFPQYSEMKP